MLVLEHHADGPLADLGGVPVRFVHDSKFSKFGVSGKPGAVHINSGKQVFVFQFSIGQDRMFPVQYTVFIGRHIPKLIL